MSDLARPYFHHSKNVYKAILDRYIYVIDNFPLSSDYDDFTKDGKKRKIAYLLNDNNRSDRGQPVKSAPGSVQNGKKKANLQITIIFFREPIGYF